MAKLILLGGLIYGGYWLYKYIHAHPNIDKRKSNQDSRCNHSWTHSSN